MLQFAKNEKSANFGESRRMDPFLVPELGIDGPDQAESADDLSTADSEASSLLLWLQRRIQARSR